MKKYKWIIFAVNLVIVLGFFNYSIVEKENLLSDGELVLLELAPVDPRSLLQGDYMTLSYDIARGVDTDSISKRGYCVVKLHDNGVARRVRIQDGKTPVYEGEYLIRYSEGEWNRINLGAESYFFQEGEGEKYEEAEYGGLRVDKNGNNVLVGLYDKDLKKIE